uniref:Reverse transcriptase domain-containing protein n=1 Tax=Tanacetum cinerariifolium TaxID=118510 RepID=A0A6L2N186_TANCI|nr:hypothetical protein [Tanacetum cinerariifolium]
MEDDDEDDAEVINPYEEADPHNRPPPASDEETEFAPPVVQIADFGNFYVGESSASRDLLEGNDEVCVPGPMPCDLRSVHRGVKRMARVLRQEELRRNGQAFDITALDSAVRANTSESSNMMRLITDLSREFSELKCQNCRAEELSRWEAWVRGRIPNSLRFQEEPSIHIAPISRADDPTMPPKRRSQTNPQLTLTQEDIDQLVQDGIAAVVREERERVRREATRAGGPERDPVTAPIARECSFASFMKCGPTQFYGTEGAVGLVRWALMKVASPTTVTFRSNSSLVCPRILSSGQCPCIVLPSVVVLVVVVVVSIVSSVVVVVVVVVVLVVAPIIFLPLSLETFSYSLILKLNFLFNQGVGHTHTALLRVTGLDDVVSPLMISGKPLMYNSTFFFSFGTTLGHNKANSLNLSVYAAIFMSLTSDVLVHLPTSALPQLDKTHQSSFVLLQPMILH